MSRFGHRDQEPVETADDLRRLAQRKVQAALAGIGAPPSPLPDQVQGPVPALDVVASAQLDVDPVTAQALDRLETYVGTLEAVDKWGRHLTGLQLVRIVLGALPVSTARDADPAEVLWPAGADEGAEGDARETRSEMATAPWAERVLRPRVLPLVQHGDHLQTSHVTLGNGVDRYVFRAEDDRVQDARVEDDRAGARSEPEAPEAEERLVAALERRYPDLPRSSTSWAPHVPQSLGWPDDDEAQRP